MKVQNQDQEELNEDYCDLDYDAVYGGWRHTAEVCNLQGHHVRTKILT